MKIFFVVPYPKGQAPSQRFRFEQYFHYLNEQNIHFRCFPFWDEKSWKILYHHGSTLKKTWALFVNFLKRWYQVFFIFPKADIVFIHREMAPIGPPIFEWITARLFRKKIIYDYDDAIWMNNTSSQNKIAAIVKWHGKVKNICKWSYKVSCGNHFLKNFALQYNEKVCYNPTTIDTDYHTPSTTKKDEENIILGWTGTHSTVKYLENLHDILAQLTTINGVKLVVISNQPPKFDFPFTFIKWKEKTEIEDLQQFDIGLMPLENNEWEEGKCGFKALQYMALGIPAVVSPVGVNKNIITDLENGILVNSPQEWFNAITKLIEDKNLRYNLGLAGRVSVENKFSVKSNAENFLSLFLK